jgi:hypothetical protein
MESVFRQGAVVYGLQLASPDRDDNATPNKVALSGTTLKVYRFMYRQGGPVGVHEVQRAMNLQSASTAHYQIRKLVDLGLVKEASGGYVVDKILFENMIRIGRSLIPIQATFAAFFGTTLIVLLTLLRPASIYGVYVFAVLINSAALGIFAYQTYRATTKAV